MIDDLRSPHARQTIETDFYDKLYFWMLNAQTGNTYSRSIQLPNGNYTGDLLGANLQIALDEMVDPIPITNFKVSYNPLEFTIGITNTSNAVEW
jgi:hypothetical protein